MAHEIQYLNLWDICSKSKSLTGHMHWPWMALYLADSEDNSVPFFLSYWILFLSSFRGVSSMEEMVAGGSYHFLLCFKFYLLPVYLFFMARVESFEK